MSAPNVTSIQPIVLHGGDWTHAAHVMLDFGGQEAGPLHFLNKLLELQRRVPIRNGFSRPSTQISIGFTRRGLQKLHLPDHILSRFAIKAPAFWAGAPLRASSVLGMSDRNAPDRWDAGFHLARAHALVSIHSTERKDLVTHLRKVRNLCRQHRLIRSPLPRAEKLPAPREYTDLPERGRWVHFGYLDGLSKVGIHERLNDKSRQQFKETSVHALGEFVLGHPQDGGSNPWVAGPGRRAWLKTLSSFFRDGSFGVVHLIEQHVADFEEFVVKAANDRGLTVEALKGLLCGRLPMGKSLAMGAPEDPLGDFDYSEDVEGNGCPFGSHVRRMNPRLNPKREPDALSEQSAHFKRARPLLRRGMPYGPAWQADTSEVDPPPRGLIGHFFCASIEDQYEHLIGEWAERVPLGSPDRGGARDPLIGAHEKGDGSFRLPRDDKGNARAPIEDFKPFITTRGIAYLFYPSIWTLKGIAQSDHWRLFPNESPR
jgi:deferrochelatase/peroxidase EfeB